MHREKPKRKNERTRLWFSCCSGDRGKICFGFENRDGKGSVLLKVGGRERVWKFVLMSGYGLFFFRLTGRENFAEGRGWSVKREMGLWQEKGVCGGCLVAERESNGWTKEGADSSEGKRFVLMRAEGDSVWPKRDLCFLFKIRGVAASFLKRWEGGRATASLLERIGLGFSLCFLSFWKITPLSIFFSSLLLWLEVHLYKKSLHVLFKEILQ